MAARWQEIKYNSKGRAYVTHYKTRFFLDEFMRQNDGTGLYYLGAFSALKIEISDCGTAARVKKF